MRDDEFILDTPAVRQFIGEVRAAVATYGPAEAMKSLRSSFAALLADHQWLPPAYQQPVTQSGMGGGIATWLLFRSGDADLSLFSLVVPPGVSTPVHDHLAWGLVGLYAGEQQEHVYAHTHDAHGDHGALELTASNHLTPGDFYVLLPPKDDIHSVETISATPSVSLHLLGNDTGCVWRHAYSPHEQTVRDFRSGWSNVPCRDENS